MNLQARKSLMIDYLRMKLDESDWHAVCDAAMDLREIEIQIKMEGKDVGENSSVVQEPKLCKKCYFKLEFNAKFQHENIINTSGLYCPNKTCPDYLRFV